MINVDYSRITAEITKQEERLNQMQAFLEARVWKLKRAVTGIEALLLAHGCGAAKMDNAYSKGYGVTEYAANIAMHVTCRAALTKGVKNKQLYEKRLAEAFAQAVTAKHNDIRVDRVYVNGGSVEMHIIVN